MRTQLLRRALVSLKRGKRSASHYMSGIKEGLSSSPQDRMRSIISGLTFKGQRLSETGRRGVKHVHNVGGHLKRNKMQYGYGAGAAVGMVSGYELGKQSRQKQRDFKPVRRV